MEIERKFLIRDLSSLPFHLEDYPHKKMEQGYLSTDPVVRVRKEDKEYILTYKSKGLMVREEYNLPLNEASYRHLVDKIDGRLIRKTRYVIPIDSGLAVELDVFEDDLAPLVLAEIEYPDEETARSHNVPGWLGEDVTFSTEYHNSVLAFRTDDELTRS